MNPRKRRAARPVAIASAIALTASAGGFIAAKDASAERYYTEWPELENNPPTGKGRIKQADQAVDTITKRFGRARPTQARDMARAIQTPLGGGAVSRANREAQEILDRLTLDQKIGQITQGELQNVTADDVAQYCLGSVLNGGGSWPDGDKNSPPERWREIADDYWQAGMDSCGIPPIWGIDSVHGNNNVIGATLFPHNIGLGAADNPALMRDIGEITAKETRVTGQPWVFAPTVAVARDDRWGRTYESYSEDPHRVNRLATPIIVGLQGDLSECYVAATIKHWVGDGGTTDGVDQGNTEVSEEELINIHGLPYFDGLEAGVLSAMPSFSSWNGEKMHGNKYLNNDILKDTLGFSGHIISDWNGIQQVPGCTASDCPQAVNSGIDLFMVPDEWREFIATTKQQVLDGVIPMERIDDAVRRVLRNKILMGLFDAKPSDNACADDSLLGAPEHREVARQAVRESLVLLKNNNDLLPLSRFARVLVTGKTANNIANQSGGWTISWQGTGLTNDDFPGATSIYDAIRQIAPNAVLAEDLSGVDLAEFDVAIAAIGEPPYAEGLGDIRSNQTLEHARRFPEDLEVLTQLRDAGLPTVTLWVAGRPLYVNKELNKSDAFVAAWLPGSEGGGIADVLFQKDDGQVNYDFKGKLAYSWPADDCQTPLNAGDGQQALFAYNHGLTYSDDGFVDELDDSTTNPQGCDPVDPGEPATDPLFIFVQGGNADPYELTIGDPTNWGAPVDLSNENNVTTLANVSAGPRVNSPSFQFGGITAKFGVDPLNQGPAQFYSIESGSTDLSSYLAAENSALVFDVRAPSPPTGQVTTRIDCVFPCRGELDLTPAYTAVSDGEWHELAVPLSCFAEAVMATDFTSVNAPFLVFTEGQWQADFADVRWEPDYTPNVTCDGQYQP